MKIKVKLFGILRRQLIGYQLDHGIEIEIPDGARVTKLLAHLKFAEPQENVVVISGGRVLNAEEKLVEGITVHIFQPVFGG